MSTVSELIGYSGDKNLGLGSNAGVPAIDTSANLNPILDAGKNIMLLDADRNTKIFDQKIKDRDTRLKLLDEGQIAAGNILDQDRPVYEKAKQAANDAFYKMIDAGGINNPKAYKAYQDEVTNLRDVVTHAQERYIEMGNLKDEQSKETVPSRIKNYQDHIDAESKKGFNQFINPYQHLLDYNQPTWLTPALDGSLIGTSPLQPTTTDKVSTTNKDGTVSTTDVKTTAPSKTGTTAGNKDNVVIGAGTTYKDKLTGLTYTKTKQYVDFGKIKTNTLNGYFNPEIGAQQDLLLKNIQDPTKTPPYAQRDYLNHLIQRAEDYNNDRGLKPGDEGYADVDKYKKALGYDDNSKSVMPNPVTGKYDIGLPAPEFAALSALASIDGNYAPETVTWDKGIDEYNLKVKEANARIGAEKALAYERYTKTKALDSQFNPQQVFNEILPKLSTVKAGGVYSNRLDATKITQALKDDLGIDPLTADDGKESFYNIIPTNVTTAKGKPLSEDQVNAAYNDWLTNPKYAAQVQKIEDHKGGDTPTILDYMYVNGANFDIDVEGLSKPKKNKTGATIEGGGKEIRSNRLQTLLNQMNEGGVKGKELLQELSGDDNDNSDGDNSTTTSSSETSETTTQ